jgi:hypothetical protein
MTDGGGAWCRAAKHIKSGEQLVRSGAMVDGEDELDEWRTASSIWVDRVTDALLNEDRGLEVDEFLTAACVPYPPSGWHEALREEVARLHDAVAFLRTLAE